MVGLGEFLTVLQGGTWVGRVAMVMGQGLGRQGEGHGVVPLSGNAIFKGH